MVKGNEEEKEEVWHCKKRVAVEATGVETGPGAALAGGGAVPAPAATPTAAAAAAFVGVEVPPARVKNRAKSKSFSALAGVGCLTGTSSSPAKLAVAAGMVAAMKARKPLVVARTAGGGVGTMLKAGVGGAGIRWSQSDAGGDGRGGSRTCGHSVPGVLPSGKPVSVEEMPRQLHMSASLRNQCQEQQGVEEEPAMLNPGVSDGIGAREGGKQRRTKEQGGKKRRAGGVLCSATSSLLDVEGRTTPKASVSMGQKENALVTSGAAGGSGGQKSKQRKALKRKRVSATVVVAGVSMEEEEGTEGSAGNSVRGKTEKVEKRGSDGGKGVLGMRNPFVSACLSQRDRQRQKRKRKLKKAAAAEDAAGGGGGSDSQISVSEEEEEDSSGYSDLDDFIVCQPGRDYEALIGRRWSKQQVRKR
jgi:hypothetical protein